MKPILKLLLLTSFSATINAATSDVIVDYSVRHQAISSRGGMVVAQEQLAANIGAQILNQGGNAVDAAVATGFALAVTLPQAGNLGGGGFMLIHMDEQQETIALDYRETAPAAAHEQLFLDEHGNVLKDKARFSHAAAGVPGTVAGLCYALKHYGTMSLKQVLQPAIALAKNGIIVSNSLAFSMARRSDSFKQDPSSVRYFLNAKQAPYQAGDKWRQPDLAKTLKHISKDGDKAFYEGAIAAQIVAEMETNDGLISAADLASYKVKVREPVWGSYLGYQIASMPPPSSGGVHLIQMLNMIETTDISADSHNSAAYIHLLVNAMKRAYADRSKYLGDPDFIDVPIAALLDKQYARRLAASFTAQATPSTEIHPGLAPAPESPDTTHFSVWDKTGNVVSNTYTLNFSFGSGKSVDGAGFLLNNEMDDFSSKPGSPNAYGLIGGQANAIAAGKRPLSSMTPTIVFKDNTPIIATGTPGGSTIITIVLQTLLNILAFDMNAAQAAHAPRIHHQWLPDILFTEEGINADTKALLRDKGYVLKANRAMGRVQTIVNTNGILQGSSDPRWPDGGVAIAE